MLLTGLARPPALAPLPRTAQEAKSKPERHNTHEKRRTKKAKPRVFQGLAWIVSACQAR